MKTKALKPGTMLVIPAGTGAIKTPLQIPTDVHPVL